MVTEVVFNWMIAASGTVITVQDNDNEGTREWRKGAVLVFACLLNHISNLAPYIARLGLPENKGTFRLIVRRVPIRTEHPLFYPARLFLRYGPRVSMQSQIEVLWEEIE